MDKIELYSDHVGAGLYYIEAPDSYCPLRGNGWYYYPTVDYCLQNNIIKSNQIKYVIKSSLTVEADHYNTFIDYLYSNLSNDLAK